MAESSRTRSGRLTNVIFPDAVRRSPTALGPDILMLKRDDVSVRGSEAQALRRLLMRMADVLQCPVSDLFGPDPEAVFGDVAELVRLWNATADSEGRQRILATARQEVARSAGEIGRSPAP